jgi:hypothetical protein
VAPSFRGGLPSYGLGQVAREPVCRSEGLNDVIGRIEARVAGDRGRSGADADRPGPVGRIRGDSMKGA